uniref:Peptidase S1 domain-containing protein n=1 Tax=Oncorhynchus mykiss TaxID=8022 RepID=A0A8K9XHQ9_ONCMY
CRNHCTLLRKRINAQPHTYLPTHALIHTCTLGQRTNPESIIEEAVPHSWQQSGTHFCGVSLTNEPPTGEHDMLMSNEAIQILKPAKVFTHSRWNPSTIKNDILLIKLATPTTLSAKVSPVCLASYEDNFAPGMTCVTSGWCMSSYQLEECKNGCSTSTPSVYTGVAEVRTWVGMTMMLN